MKEISLKPNIHENPVMIEKITGWKEETRFWETEGNAFLRLVQVFKMNCKPREKEILEDSEFRLIQFQLHTMKEIGDSIRTLELALAGKFTSGLFRKTESRIEAGRRVYRELKSRILPFFPKLFTVQIW